MHATITIDYHPATTADDLRSAARDLSHLDGRISPRVQLLFKLAEEIEGQPKPVEPGPMLDPDWS